jgi:eukaryotic-like serine/threonine-protein kinase
VIHRDLKPANILLQARNSELGARNDEDITNPCPGSDSSSEFRVPSSEFVPKVSDFGLAKLHALPGATVTETGAFLGTPSYTAPEQAAGQNREIGPAADVYSLGAIGYELATGRPPFTGVSPLDVLVQVRTLDPVPPSRLVPRLPRDLETVLLKCLE